MRENIYYPFRFTSASEWTALSNDTTGLAATNCRISQVGALTFAKANGADNKTYAGVYRSDLGLDLIGRPLDLCPEDRIGVCFFVGATTNVAYLTVRLGTSATVYNEWKFLDSTMTGNAFNVLTLKLGNCTCYGNAIATGWNPAAITYAEVAMHFDGETNELAGLVIDSVWFQKNVPTVA